MIVPPLVRTMMVHLTLLEAFVEFILELYLVLQCDSKINDVLIFRMSDKATAKEGKM